MHIVHLDLNFFNQVHTNLLLVHVYFVITSLCKLSRLMHVCACMRICICACVCIHVHLVDLQDLYCQSNFDTTELHHNKMEMAIAT